MEAVTRYIDDNGGDISLAVQLQQQTCTIRVSATTYLRNKHFPLAGSL